MNFCSLHSNCKFPGYFYVFLFWITQISAFIPVDQNNKTHYVSGAHVETLHDPLFYDIFVPVIFEIDLPTWNLTNFKLQWPTNFSSDCKSSDTWGDNWTHMACPVVYHMNNVTEHFIKNIMDWKSFNSSRNSKPVYVESCHEIVPHFKSYFLNHIHDEYLHDLKNCPLGQVIYEKLSVPWQEVNETLYATMLSRFIEENISPQKYRMTGYSRYVTTTNAFSTFQIAELLDYIYTSSKWSQSISTCSEGNIPYTLIPKETLSSSLKEIERTITSKDKYDLTIAADDFSNYYRLPLADCAFTTKNSLLVRILIPLRKTIYQYKLATVRSIPFLRTYRNFSEICEYGSINNHQILIEQNTGAIIPTQCFSGELCIIPDLANRPVTDYCLAALVNKASEDTLHFCEIQCNYFNTKHLPYFRRLSSHQYAVLGKSNMDIFVSCDTQPFKVLDPPPIGTLELTLPCPCQLVHRRDSLHSMAPCGNKLIIRKIMPIAWSPNSIPFINESEFLNNFKHDEFQEFEKEEKHQNSNSHNVQLLILSSVVIVLFCSNILLMFIVTKLYKRICKLELFNSQSLGVECSNIYETPLPMCVRANDD